MSDTFGSLGQVLPPATTLTTAYTCPALRRATVEVVICNQSTAATVRLSHAIGGAADTGAQYLLFDFPIDAGETLITTRLTVRAGDVVRVYSSSNSVAFNVNGIEEDV